MHNLDKQKTACSRKTISVNMLRSFIHVLFIFFLCNCNRVDKTVKHGFWKYKNGFSIGDPGDIFNFYSEPYKISNDTIFHSNIAKAVVLKTENGLLLLKSVATGETGTYIHFADSISNIQIDLIAPPIVEEPLIPQTPPEPKK